MPCSKRLASSLFRNRPTTSVDAPLIDAAVASMFINVNLRFIDPTTQDSLVVDCTFDCHGAPQVHRD